MLGWGLAIAVIITLIALGAVALGLFAIADELTRLRKVTHATHEEIKATRKRVNELEPHTPAAKSPEKRLSEWIEGGR